MRTFLFILVGIFALFIGWVLYISAFGPATHVYLGSELPASYKKELKDLDLLGKGETIKYFYSDAMVDIKKGLYFVTDEKFVAYDESWEEPATLIPFEAILSVEMDQGESMFDDSFVYLESEDWVIEFPLSIEKGRDQLFYEYLLNKTKFSSVE